jgi:UrcA family protein
MRKSSYAVKMTFILLAAPVALGLITLGASVAVADPDPDTITISAPKTKVISHDLTSGAPVEKTTVTAHVAYELVTLTTNSGVSLLKDAVREAARKVCYDAGPGEDDGGECVERAISGAQPQIEAAIVRARNQYANK